MTNKRKIFSSVDGIVCEVKVKRFSTSSTNIQAINQEIIDPVKSQEDLFIDRLLSESKDTYSHLLAWYGSICRKNFSIESENYKKSFSIASIEIRMQEGKKNIRERFRRTFRDFRNYFKRNSKKLLDPDNSDLLKLYLNLFITDMQQLFQLIGPQIVKGRTISAILGLSTLGSSELNKLAKEYQVALRKALISQNNTGAVPPTQYKKFGELMNKMLDKLKELVTEGAISTGTTSNNQSTEISIDNQNH